MLPTAKDGCKGTWRSNARKWKVRRDEFDILHRIGLGVEDNDEMRLLDVRSR